MTPSASPPGIYKRQLQKGISQTSIFIWYNRRLHRPDSHRVSDDAYEMIIANGQASRLISTARLNTLLCLHLQPINVIVSDEPSDTLWYGKINLGGGFALRCFQRLSRPNIATQPCRWHDNWCTSGSSTRVLSYYGQLPSIFLRPRQIRTELSHDVLNPTHVPL